MQTLTSLIQLLLDENITIRCSENQIQSILKHAIQISDANVENKLGELNNSAIRIIQAEDIIKQITDRIIQRTKAIDEILLELQKISSQEQNSLTMNSFDILKDRIHEFKNNTSCNSIKQYSLDEGSFEQF